MMSSSASLLEARSIDHPTRQTHRAGSAIPGAPILSALLFCCAGATADTLTTEPDSAVYHYVSHYSTVIDAPPDAVWPYLLRLETWMVDFSLTPVSGTPGEPGEVRRLYEGQDYLMQLTSVVPNRLLVMANLPSDDGAEQSSGVAIITLDGNGGATTLNLTMSRRYAPRGEVDAAFTARRATRESMEFQQRTRNMWQGFLTRLKDLSEDGAQQPP